MSDQRSKFVYLTFAETEAPVLNICIDDAEGTVHRFPIEREQLFRLNYEISSAIWKGMAR